jgi:hypothetical protein
MGTVKATITLTSSDITSDALNLTHNQTMTLTQGGIIRYAVTGTSTSAPTTLYTAGDQVAPVYLYVKNTDATATDYVYIFLDSTDKKSILKLGGGEAGWITCDASSTYQCWVTTAETIIEYGVFA